MVILIVAAMFTIFIGISWIREHSTKKKAAASAAMEAHSLVRNDSCFHPSHS